MVSGVTRTARISHCRQYRFTLGRHWDQRPKLLVVMFNPSRADASMDDPTVQLLCHVAAHNGFGGVTVVNGIPLRSPAPGDAADMVNTWDKRQAWDERDILHHNLAIVQEEVAKAAAVLLAWGALARLCPAWFDHVEEQIREVLPASSELYCLGRTKEGYPKHPLARGVHKVRVDSPLVPWGRR